MRLVGSVLRQILWADIQKRSFGYDIALYRLRGLGLQLVNQWGYDAPGKTLVQCEVWADHKHRIHLLTGLLGFICHIYFIPDIKK